MFNCCHIENCCITDNITKFQLKINWKHNLKIQLGNIIHLKTRFLTLEHPFLKIRIKWRSMDPWANFILIIYISGEKVQENVLFHHLIHISGEIRHFLVHCPHSTRKCLISPLKMFYFATENVLFRHRFPVLFLLPRFNS